MADSGILLAVAVFASCLFLICTWRVSRALWLEVQEDRERERARVLRESTRRRLAEGADAHRIDSISDLVTYADAKLSRGLDDDNDLATCADVTVADVTVGVEEPQKGASKSELGGGEAAGIDDRESARFGPNESRKTESIYDGSSNRLSLPLDSGSDGAVTNKPLDHAAYDTSSPSNAKEQQSPPRLVTLRGETAVALKGGDWDGKGSPPTETLTGDDWGSRGDAAGEVVIPVTSGECAVCLVEFEDEIMLRRMHCCRHLFHQECLVKWLRYRLSCPICRVKLKQLLM